MEIVEKGVNNPGYCIFTKDLDGPYLDTGFWINEIDPYAYIHVPFVETMGRAVGMVPKHEVEALQEKARLMAEELVELREKVEALTRVAEVVA